MIRDRSDELARRSDEKDEKTSGNEPFFVMINVGIPRDNEGKRRLLTQVNLCSPHCNVMSVFQITSSKYLECGGLLGW